MSKGFTLTELLAVVMIVAILMGVGLPQYRKAVEKARVTEAISMLRSIYDSSERLAGEFGYRSYAALVASKGENNYSFARMDMFDTAQLPRGCSLAGGDSLSAASSNAMDCKRFSYRALLQGANGRYYAAAKLLRGPHKGTYIVFDRDEQELYCKPKTGAGDDFCEMLGLDLLDEGAGLSF